MSDTGKGAIVRELVGAAAAEWSAETAKAAAEQLPMFPVPGRSRGNERAIVGRQRELERRQGPGRPPDATNLTTRAFRSWLLGRGVSPLTNLMFWAMLPPDMFAHEAFGLEASAPAELRIQAFREWRILQSELAPYLHARLAMVDEDGRPVPFLAMTVAGRNVTISNGETPWAVRERLAKELQSEQGLSEAASAVSHGAQSHGPAK